MATKKAPKEEKKDSPVKKNDNAKEIYWIIGVMVVALIAILLIPSISRWYNTFNYQGLTFTKEMYGQIPVYHYYYYVTPSNGQQQYQNNIYLRDDPRTNNVSIIGKIVYPPLGSTIYLSINQTGIIECSNALRDVATLNAFILDNAYTVKGGYADQSLAQQNNGTYMTCATNPGQMVIALQHSNETSVVVNGTCYNFNINTCQGLLDAVEKFEVQSIIDAKS